MSKEIGAGGKKICVKDQSSEVELTQTIKDSIIYMRHATPNAIEEICNKMEITFEYRRKIKKENLLTEFPRLVDTIGLVRQKSKCYDYNT